jgi:hypothetical protein
MVDGGSDSFSDREKNTTEKTSKYNYILSL